MGLKGEWKILVLKGNIQKGGSKVKGNQISLQIASFLRFTGSIDRKGCIKIFSRGDTNKEGSDPSLNYVNTELVAFPVYKA